MISDYDYDYDYVYPYTYVQVYVHICTRRHRAQLADTVHINVYLVVVCRQCA